MNRIKELLREKGINQVELANRMGIGKMAVSQMLRVGNPRLDNLELIAKVLEVPIWELFFSREEMKREFELPVYGTLVVGKELHSIRTLEELKAIVSQIESTIIK